MGANLMYLKEGTKDHFMGFLRREFPHLVHSYNRLYAGAYAKREYATAVRGMIETLQQRYDLRRRGTRNAENAQSVPSESDDPYEERAAFEQAALPWDTR